MEWRYFITTLKLASGDYKYFLCSINIIYHSKCLQFLSSLNIMSLSIVCWFKQMAWGRVWSKRGCGEEGEWGEILIICWTHKLDFFFRLDLWLVFVTNSWYKQNTNIALHWWIWLLQWREWLQKQMMESWQECLAHAEKYGMFYNVNPRMESLALMRSLPRTTTFQ